MKASFISPSRSGFERNSDDVSFKDWTTMRLHQERKLHAEHPFLDLVPLFS